MPIILTTPPAIEPVTLDEAKLHLKVDTADDDALITNLIAAARARAELLTNRAFITQHWKLCLDGWQQVIALPYPPLQSVTAVSVYAPDDTPTVLDASTYQVDVASGRLALKPNASPPIVLRRLDAIEIAFVAGYGDAASDVPALIREAILELVAAFYANRGDVEADTPLDAMALLAPYRILSL